MTPSVGRIVHYNLTEQDAEKINRRRTDGASIATRIQGGGWPIGAQAHVGNLAEAGQVYPMVIVRVWGESDVSAVNGQVLLDGTDCLWVTSVGQVVQDSVDKAGLWCEPPRV